MLDVPVASPASTAGLRPTHRDVFGDIILGDVIITLDTRPIRTAADLASYLDEKRWGARAGGGRGVAGQEGRRAAS